MYPFKGEGSILNNPDKKRTRLFFTSTIGMVIILVWVFLGIGAGIRNDEMRTYDLAIISGVQTWVSEDNTAIMMAITHLGSKRLLWIGILAGAALMVWKNHFSYSVFLILTVWLGAFTFNKMLKGIFQRERPDILPLIEQGGYSFPSGHAMNAIIFYGAAIFLLIKLLNPGLLRAAGIAVAAILVILIGLSRIYLGVHYPSDVIAGFSIGAAWLVFVIALFQLSSVRKHRR